MTIYADFVEQLRLAPAGDLLIGAENRISAVPQTVECTAFVDVPTATRLASEAGGLDRADCHSVSAKKPA